MVTKLLTGSSLILSAAAIAALTPSTSPTTPGTQTIAAAAPMADLAPALMSWDRLRQSDSLDFADYASFLLAHPNWPGEARMARLAESKADPAVASPSLVVSFLTRYPPKSARGKALLARALLATGRPAEARDTAKLAWLGGPLAPADEAVVLGLLGGAITATEQDQRMERLLASRSTSAAQRQILLVSSARRPIYAARLAMQMQSADAAALADALGSPALSDPGFVIDRATWLRDTGRWIEARELVARPMALDAPPLDAEKWLGALLGFATSASRDNQAQLAYAIALNGDKAFPASTDVRKQSLAIRDSYTSLMWIGGQAALKGMGRPSDAIALFDRYAGAAQTPQTQTKGWYWAGRAALAAQDATRANGYFGLAAAHGDQFYGQLAAERLGRSAGIIPEPAPIAITGAQRAAFDANELVRAARLLGSQGRWQDQTLFLRAIAQSIETDADHVLSGELARAIARPDLGVMVARQWRNNGAADPIRIGFPELALPAYVRSQWTMIHAITRQESQFDRQIVSHAGARGLMQLMPATAQEQAGKLGLDYDFNRLTADPQYNVMLGSSFFARILDSFGGNYVLAVAAYNAGPGNVRKWLAANGDPRMPGVDILEWIEAIPLTETRGYVQRVLENAVVYDRLNPGGALMPQTYRLSAYLGKRNPG